MFRALVVDVADGKPTVGLRTLDESALPDGDVTVEVSHSSLNYKDGLVLGGGSGLVKKFPHVPGIDFAGKVRESAHPGYQVGDSVVLTGWRVGEVRFGGYAELARVKGDWLVPLPAGWTPRQAMAVGTAGFTAMLAVIVLERDGLTPERGEVLVTGAAGGVGSVAIALLSRLGYRVVASTGRASARDYLVALGASEIIDRGVFNEVSARPLESERWAGCVDSVGGNTLARVLAQTKYGGAVATVGLAGGSKLETTVMPFILRGVNLLGIDSVMCPGEPRRQAWQRLARDLPGDLLESMIVDVGLGDLARLGPDILAGQVRGRVVVDVRR